MKSDTTNTKSQTSKTTGQALSTPTKAPRKSATTTIVSASPDSDDSSNSGESPACGGIEKDKTGEIQTPETSSAVATHAKPISMSESMANNYLFYDGRNEAPQHKSVSYLSKKSKDRVEKFVFSVDLINKDKKLVTLTIWEEELRTITFFEKWFR